MVRRNLGRLRRRLRLGHEAREARAFRLRMARDGVLASEENPRTVVATTFGAHCRIRTPIYLTQSSLGDWSYVEANCRISLTHVGKFTAIAPGCQIGLAEHPSAVAASSHPVFYRRDLSRGFDFADRDLRSEMTPTTIGNDVWIGAGAIVKGGIVIGDGAIVGAGAVVTKDVPPYAIVTGVPATVRRYRFEESDIEFLMSTRWWDWDVSILRENFAALHDIHDLRRLTDQFCPASEKSTDGATPSIGPGSEGGLAR